MAGDGDEDTLFKHQQFDEPTRQIRLLRFLDCHDSELHLTINAYDLESAPEFHAISYTWGKPGNEQPLIIDERTFYVRDNCLKALQQVRHHYPNRSVWIDSICINQTDLPEKGQQVQRIWDIYTKASLVLSCIGDHHDDSEILLPFSETLKELDYPLPRSRDTATPWLDWLPTLGEERVLRLVGAWSSFAARPYWKRLWVVQELCSKVCQPDTPLEILCGHDIFPWHSIVLLSGVLDMVVTQLMDRGLMQRPQGYMDLSIWFFTTTPSTDVELGDAVYFWGRFGCADPRDRVYGILHLAEPINRELIVPDYDISIYDLAKKVCELSWYRMAHGVLRTFDIDHKHPEVQALVNRRSTSHAADGPISSSQVTKLMDNSGHIHKDKGYAPYVVLSKDGSGNLTAELLSEPPYEANREYDARVQQANSAIKQLHQATVGASEEIHGTINSAQPKAVTSKGNTAGLLCPEAREGDLLVPVYCGLDGILLILRQQHETVFDVVGQGFLWDRYAVPDGPDTGAFRAKIDLSFTGEDMVVLFGQDLKRRRQDADGSWLPFDVHSRFTRLTTRPLESPLGAATLVDEPWPPGSESEDET